MKSLLALCVVASLFSAAAQEPAMPALRKGVSVQMAVASHAVAMRAADEPQATVISITADGTLFSGIEPTTPAALGNLRAETIYVKADSRVPFQTLLTVLDALRGKSVVLLALPPAKGERAAIMPPYGITLAVVR